MNGPKIHTPKAVALALRAWIERPLLPVAEELRAVPELRELCKLVSRFSGKKREEFFATLKLKPGKELQRGILESRARRLEKHSKEQAS